MKLTLCLQVAFVVITTDAARLNHLAELKENEINSEKPFHLFNTVGAPAIPIIRPDNTTKSRVVDDTLLREGPKEFEVGFDSLDNHLQENLLPATDHKVSVFDVGNLHPEEVYYADNNLIIIKGGGFQGPSFVEPEPSVEDEEEFNFNEILSQPPNPHEEYNGNVPTIVKPPSNHPKFGHRSKPTAHPATPLALFLPAQMLALPNDPQYFYYPIQYEVRPVSPGYLWFLLQHGLPVYQAPRPALSFIGDTNVNFIDPRPQINPDAEIVHFPVHTEKYTHHSQRRRFKPLL